MITITLDWKTLSKAIEESATLRSFLTCAGNPLEEFNKKFLADRKFRSFVEYNNLSPASVSPMVHYVKTLREEFEKDVILRDYLIANHAAEVTSNGKYTLDSAVNLARKVLK